MTRSTNMEHVEVLRHMKETIKAIMPSEVAALDAAIAALSAPQPPAEAQAQGVGEVVAWEWEYVGYDPYPRWKTVARALHEMNPQNPPYPETWRPTRPLVYGDAPPPSEPVGVEGLPERWRREAPRARVDVGEDASLAWREAVYWCAFQLEAALAQQPAADGGFTAADMMDARQEGRKEAEARAERLAEALRDALECGEDGDWQSARNYINEALRDQGQEARNG